MVMPSVVGGLFGMLLYVCHIYTVSQKTREL